MSLNINFEEFLSSEIHLECLNIHSCKVTVSKLVTIEHLASVKTTEDKWYQDFANYKVSRKKELISHRRKVNK